jgi:hypothetical protein
LRIGPFRIFNGGELGGIEYELQRHPDSGASAVSGVRVEPQRHGSRFLIRYTVDAPADRLVLPPPAAPRRTDGLWRSTCFELFLRAAGSEYFEFNFSPSGQWAAYGFSGYREGMQPLPLDTPPVIEVRDDSGRFSLSVALSLPGAFPLRFGVSAIIEERSGATSYWALSHPPGKPDFHHACCFADYTL